MKCYEFNFDIDIDEKQIVRVKIFDATKSLKNKVLNHMKIDALFENNSVFH